MAQISGGTTNALLEVDTTAKAARASLYKADGNRLTEVNGAARDTTNDEALITAGVNDGNIRFMRVDRIGSQAVALNNILLSEAFEGTTLAANRFSAIATTMAATQTTSGGLLINSGNITTINTGYFYRSLRQIPRTQRSIVQFRCRARVEHYNNAVAEIGLGDASTFNGAHTNGAYWQYTTGGAVQPVLTYNGVDITGTAVTGLNASNYYVWGVVCDDDAVSYFIQDSSTGLVVAERSIPVPLTQARQFAATHLYAFARLYNSASAPATAPHLIATGMDVVQLDGQLNMPAGHILALNGQGAHVSPTAFTQTAAWTNSAEPASATLANGTAGYATLGGRFQFAAVAGAATDYCLFGFAVPAPYSFVCTGVDIDTKNIGAAVATTGTVLEWAVGVDQSLASLATAGIVRVPIGMQSFAVGAAIGAQAARVTADFSQAPLVTHGGRFMTVALRMPVGTATASQIIAGIVNIKGYYI